MKTFNIYYQTHFEIWFNSTFDTFQILHIFHKILGKLDLEQFKLVKIS